MKNLFSLLIIFLFGYTAFAQSVTKKVASEILGPRNAIKTNLVSLAFTSMNISYEFKMAKNISVGTMLGYKLPQTITLDGIANLNDSDDAYQYTGDITPEGMFVNPYMRFYTNEAITGFYLEPFVRYYNYNFLVPYEYTKNDNLIYADADGTASGFGGGLSFGSQFALGPSIVLDIFAGMGIASGSAHIETSDGQLEEEDYLEFKQSIENNVASTELNVPFYGKIVDGVEAGANSTSAWADVDNLAFPILRFGIVLGAAF